MKRLGFKQHMVTRIIMGKKVQTLRKPKKREGLEIGIGEEFIATCMGKPFAVLFAVETDTVAHIRLDEGDAEREGVKSLAVLDEALRKIYPKQRYYRRIQFRYLGEPDA